MNYKQKGIERETMFKDSILSSAEAKSMAIISDAENWRKKQLEEAQESCEVADYDTIATRIARNFERDLSATMQEQRRGLLAYRTQLVEDVFNEITQKLVSFSDSESYLPWLEGRLAKYKNLAEKGAVTVFLRKKDLAHQATLEKVLPSCTIQPSDEITLGGLKISDGHRLFDETLEAGLAAERETFYSTSNLAL